MMTTCVQWVGAGTRASRVPTVADNISNKKFEEEAQRKLGSMKGGAGKHHSNRDINNDDDDDDDYDDKFDTDDVNNDEDDDDGPSIPLGDDIAVALQRDEFLIDIVDPDEEEEDQILPTDLVLISTSTDHESHSLIVTVFDDIESMNSYNHHDYFLTNLPLCLEWLDFSAGRDGNFAAVGSLDCEGVDVWDLDVMNSMEPLLTLGSTDKTPKKSIISLSWNPTKRNFIAAGSSDNLIRLWSVDRAEEPVYIANDVHSNSVQVLKWNPNNANQLLSASFDCTARLHDLTAPNDSVQCALSRQPEAACWLPGGNVFAVSQEKGVVQLFDIRRLSAALCSMHTHSPTSDVTSIVATSIDNKVLVATCATDGSLALWSADAAIAASNSGSSAPLAQIYQRQAASDPLFCLDFCRDAPMLLACGGMHGFVARNVAELVQQSSTNNSS